jgi:hypothetical protein
VSIDPDFVHLISISYLKNTYFSFLEIQSMDRVFSIKEENHKGM